MKSIKSILVFSLLLFACNKSETDKHLSFLNKKDNSIDVTGWVLIQSFKNHEVIEYNLEKSVKDTLIYLSFIYNARSGEYYILTNERSFFTKDYYHEFSINSRDTLYHFKCLKSLVKNRYNIKFKNCEFIVGKYYYMWYREKFNERQRVFFESKFDSLRKIRGNNLPELVAPDSIKINVDTMNMGDATTVNSKY